MRIFALLTDVFGGRGGIAKFNRDLLNSLSGEPVIREITVLARIAKCSPEEVPPKIRCVREAGGGKTRFVWHALREGRRMKNADLMICGHVHLLPVAFMVRWFGFKAPILLILHGTDAWQPTGNPVTNFLASRVNEVVAVTKVTAERFAKWSRFPGTAHILPNCIDLEKFERVTEMSKQSFLADLESRTMLYTLARLSSLERYKGVDEVIDIFPALKQHKKDLVYVVAGEGDDLDRLRKKVEDAGLEKDILFAGYVSEAEKTTYYSRADAFVMPGWGEGFGIVYLEAMACGTPVVGSVLDGSREALMDGQLGVLVDPGNPQDLKRGILEALSRKKGVRPEGLDHFSYTQFRERVRDLLKAVLSAGESSG